MVTNHEHDVFSKPSPLAVEKRWFHDQINNRMFKQCDILCILASVCFGHSFAFYQFKLNVSLQCPPFSSVFDWCASMCVFTEILQSRWFKDFPFVQINSLAFFYGVIHWNGGYWSVLPCYRHICPTLADISWEFWFKYVWESSALKEGALSLILRGSLSALVILHLVVLWSSCATLQSMVCMLHLKFYK